MPETDALLQSQRAFAAALRGRAGHANVLPLLAGNAAHNEALLSLYRGNAVGNAGKALSLAYPVIERIVGPEFFSGLCRVFWAANPSCSGDLNEYGSNFADFLGGFPPAAGLPYLSDVARVEWLVLKAAQALDHVPCEISQLAEVAPESVGDLHFVLQPGLALLSSQWPVCTIWRQHQPDYPGQIDIDLDDAECLAVYRRGFRVDVSKLSGAEHSLWYAAQQGRPLAAMLDDAFAADENLDVQATLRAGFLREFVIALCVSTD